MTDILSRDNLTKYNNQNEFTKQVRKEDIYKFTFSVAGKVYVKTKLSRGMGKTGMLSN